MIKECGFEFVQNIMYELKWKPEGEEPETDEDEPSPNKAEEEKQEEQPAQQ